MTRMNTTEIKAIMVIGIPSKEQRNSRMKISFGLSFFLAETDDPISSIPCIFHNHVKYPSPNPPLQSPCLRMSISPRRLLLYSIFRHYVFLDLSLPRSEVYIIRGMIIWQIRDASVHSIFISSLQDSRATGNITRKVCGSSSRFTYAIREIRYGRVMHSVITARGY